MLCELCLKYYEPDLGAGGRRFESYRPDHLVSKKKHLQGFLQVLFLLVYPFFLFIYPMSTPQTTQ